MGFINGKILGLSFLTAVCLCGLFREAAAQDSGASATLNNFVLPYYHERTGKLQFVLYGVKATNMGNLIEMEDVLIDMVQPTIKDINDVDNYQELKLYKMTTDYSVSQEFWKNKKHTDAFISSPASVFDKTIKTVKGDGPIHFRSPLMDIDGVGFDADFKTRVVNVRSRAKVVLWQSTIDKNRGAKAEK